MREGVEKLRIIFAIKAIKRNAKIAMVLTIHVEPKSKASSVIALVSSKRKAAPNIKKWRLIGNHIDFIGIKSFTKTHDRSNNTK